MICLSAASCMSIEKCSKTARGRELGSVALIVLSRRRSETAERNSRGPRVSTNRTKSLLDCSQPQRRVRGLGEHVLDSTVTRNMSCSVGKDAEKLLEICGDGIVSLVRWSGSQKDTPETKASRLPEDVLMALTSAGTMLSSVYQPTYRQYYPTN